MNSRSARPRAIGALGGAPPAGRDGRDLAAAVRDVADDAGAAAGVSGLDGVDVVLVAGDGVPDRAGVPAEGEGLRVLPVGSGRIAASEKKVPISE